MRVYLLHFMFVATVRANFNVSLDGIYPTTGRQTPEHIVRESLEWVNLGVKTC